jgi:hypothetical protein
MKILDKAAKLEKALLERLSRRSDIMRHPLEVYRAILDDIEDATEPGARGARIFPYHQVNVAVWVTDAHQRATAEAVFAEAPALEARVRARLRQAGCTDVEGVSVNLKFVDAADTESSGREYQIEYGRQATRPRPVRTPKPSGAERRELQLAVAAGKASRPRFSFSGERINIGRLESVVDRQQRVVRRNQVAFVDDADPINQSVSRSHAHIRFDDASGEIHLHDDGSTHGTRVVRAGRTIEVPRGARGLLLRDGDEVVLGQARLRVTIGRTKPQRRRTVSP